MLDALRSLNELAQKRGQTLAQMALAWLISKPEVTSVIVGASSVAQLEQNLGALDNTVFSPEELFGIDSLSLPVQIRH